MTVRDLLTALQALPWDAELLAFEAGRADYCAREVDAMPVPGWTLRRSLLGYLVAAALNVAQ